VAVAPGTPNKSAVRQFAVVSASFGNSLDIWYARIPVSGGKVGWLQTPPTTAVPRPKQPAEHVKPTEVRPPAGQPHFKQWPSAPAESWPVAYVRGPGANPKGPRTVTVQFQCTSALIDGSFDVSGAGPGGLATDSKSVTFSKGLGTVTFTLTSVPPKVKRLSRALLIWSFKKSGVPEIIGKCTSAHTFYFVDAAPVSALGASEGEQAFFELYDWSCRWADGQAGATDVVGAIWKQFSPIQVTHDTGFVYWRNSDIPGPWPAQTMPDAIRSVDPGAGLGQFSVSCKVFDRMFTNSVALHGVKSSEVILTPNARFATGGVAYLLPTYWNIGNPAAQGNPNGPPSWGNHWIADVNNGGTWELYDPSYGANSPWTASPAVGGSLVPPAAYERAAGVNFDAKPVAPGPTKNFVTANPNDPRLTATINFAN
jgi:hypothetical protein